jgi:TfoX/Sxy family transcriptional regulator of competence genes
MPHGPDFTKAPPELAARFSATVSALPGAQVRQMFGYPAGFVNGNLFTGIFASSWFVRLPDDDRYELASAGGTAFSPMPGRPMREYLVMPDGLASDPEAVEAWVRRALEYGSRLPPKAKR